LEDKFGVFEDQIRKHVSGQDKEFKLRYEKSLGLEDSGRRSFVTSDLRFVSAGNIGKSVVLSGRVVSKREMGQSCFVDVQYDGERAQVHLDKKFLKKVFDDFIVNVGVGDFVNLEGEVFRTQKGHVSVKAHRVDLISKTLRTLPKTHYAVRDVNYRAITILQDKGLRDKILSRSKIYDVVRSYLVEKGFVEVETPIIQPIYGGANAKPFETVYHAHKKQKAYLRISNELYLKRLVIAGVERVFEFSKDFRNEGIDQTHNPEFTQLEFYESYSDYNDTERHVKEIFKRLCSFFGRQVYNFFGHAVDFSKGFEVYTMVDSIKKFGGLDFDVGDVSKTVSYCRKRTGDKSLSYGLSIFYLFEEFVESKLIQPTIIKDFPIETSPLAKNHRSNEGFVERFEIFIGGKEFGNSYTELNDAIEQRRRFLHQESQKDSDEEHHKLDENFLQNMEYGMPPTGGVGIGMDRVCMLFLGTDKIKDVLAFPYKKEEKE